MTAKYLPLLAAVLLSLTCPPQGLCELAAAAPEDPARTAAIKELLAFFEKRSSKTPTETQPGSVKYYRNGPEVVCEARFAEKPNKVVTNQTTRSRAIELLGLYFSVGDIRRYGSLGIAFTMIAIGPDGVEIARGTAKFDEVLAHYHGHNFK